MFFVEYLVKAQFTPCKEVDMISDMRIPSRFKNVSLYRGSRLITVFSVPTEKPQIQYTQKIENYIGGIMGMLG